MLLAQDLTPTAFDFPFQSNEHEIRLPTGKLTVNVSKTDLPLEELCGFAARRNPKRGFLFVSKVLGKHIAVKPSRMKEVHALLAAKIGEDLPGPIVVIGMAETAICLGHGVYEQYVAMTGRFDVVFSHSTRYQLARPVLLQFLEEHSHAADHIVYLPEAEQHSDLYKRARSLVLVDDEASTGKTFVNLARAFKERIPSLENIVTAVITDWRGSLLRAQTHTDMPVPSNTIELLSGEYQFAPAPSLVSVNMPQVAGNGCTKDSFLSRNYGRLGLCGPYSLPLSHAIRAAEIADRHRDSRVLVVGTGEFAFPPFRFACELERLGIDVSYQTTTRSPIMVGNAIGSVLNHTDNYGDGIANFLYNVSEGQYDLVVIAHETPGETLDPTLTSALGAITMEM